VAGPPVGWVPPAILKNIGYTDADIKELVSKGLAKVEN